MLALNQLGLVLVVPGLLILMIGFVSFCDRSSPAAETTEETIERTATLDLHDLDAAIGLCEVGVLSPLRQVAGEYGCGAVAGPLADRGQESDAGQHCGDRDGEHRAQRVRSPQRGMGRQYRGMGRRNTAEMAAAMVLPVLPSFAWSGSTSARAPSAGPIAR